MPGHRQLQPYQRQRLYRYLRRKRLPELGSARLTEYLEQAAVQLEAQLAPPGLIAEVSRVPKRPSQPFVSRAAGTHPAAFWRDGVFSQRFHISRGRVALALSSWSGNNRREGPHPRWFCPG